MFSRVFIDRPIFATVLSIVITLGGGIALFTLPIAQYPDITPPTVEVTASYPGANSQVVADTVAAPIEQQVNGVEGMMYMSSQCTNDGTYTLTITFKLGTDLNIAQVLVQNRVNLAQPVLPSLVQRRGISVKKKSPSVLMIVNLFSKDGSRSSLDLSNYATIQLRDELSRLQGVGDVTYIGQRDYSMRVWLDANKMSANGLSATDVQHAVEQQNVQVAAGQIGQPPVPTGQAYQYTMTTLGRLSDPRQFGDIIVKIGADGRLVRLRDVARVELGALSYDQTCTLDGQPSVALSIYQLPGSNALQTARLVKDKMKELKPRFPQGMDYSVVYDTTPFINESISEVFNTLRDATILVAVVVLVFLQNWRSALIPLVAVPVAVVGTFAAMAFLGFSLNNLTLFGLVLAIGIVVDDAIVVVEAVEHHIEHGLSPRDATIKAMEQVSGPVIAVGLVLAAVFVPCMFIGGIIGQFFKQFALTIAVSTVISAFNSLTLSPALAAILLKPREKGTYEALPKAAFAGLGAWAGWVWLAPWFTGLGDKLNFLAYLNGLLDLATGVLTRNSDRFSAMPLLATAALLAGAVVGWLLAGPLNVALGWLFKGFNVGFDFFTGTYTAAVGKLLRVSVLVLLVYGGLLYLTYHSFTTTPTGFIPQQDKGYLLVNVQLPDASSLERTEAVMRRLDDVILGKRVDQEVVESGRTVTKPVRAGGVKGVKHTVAVAGQSILLNANTPNFGAMYVMLDDFHQRGSHELSGEAIAHQLQERLREEITEAQVNVFGAPPVEGLGTAGGFKIIIEDRGDNPLARLQEQTEEVIAEADQARAPDGSPALRGLFTSFRANTPWLFVDVDRTQAQMNNVPLNEVFSTLQIYLGSYYVNDFNRFGRTWQVNLQAADVFREQVEGTKQLKVRTTDGKMLPLATVATVKPTPGPVMVVRYNMYPAAAVNGTAAPGVSSGQALTLMEEKTKAKLDPSMQFEWTELALLQLQTGGTAMLVFLLAVVLVFLVLAAQYESWSLPLAVILVVPMCLLCSIVGVIMTKMDVNIFTQVGFIVLVGLACKNAILIVEFAKAQREAGVPIREATLAACKLRLRPIIMTSFAFILGVVPLVMAEGAGAEMRRTLGTAVFGGMLGVTLFGIFLTPVFYFVIQWVTERFYGPPTARTEVPTDALPEANGH